MTETGDNCPAWDYDQYPKTLPPDDYWGQVRRTMHGAPLPDHQIQLIVSQCAALLDLSPSDSVLDLACGNGALAHRLYGACATWVGVDRSAYLIEVAKANFEQVPAKTFYQADVAQWVCAPPVGSGATKALCYGSFAYFDTLTAARMLRGLRANYPCLDRVVLGALPDRDRARDFFGARWGANGHLLDAYQSAIGIWRAPAHLCALVARCGWSADIVQLPAGASAAHYRYDAVLRPVT